MPRVEGYLFLDLKPRDWGRNAVQVEAKALKAGVCATCSGKRQDEVWSESDSSNAMKAVDGMRLGWSQDTGAQLQLKGTMNNQQHC